MVYRVRRGTRWSFLRYFYLLLDFRVQVDWWNIVRAFLLLWLHIRHHWPVRARWRRCWRWRLPDLLSFLRLDRSFSCTAYCVTKARNFVLARFNHHLNVGFLSSRFLYLCCRLFANVCVADDLDVVVVVNMNWWWSDLLMRLGNLVIIWMIFHILRLLLSL